MPQLFDMRCCITVEFQQSLQRRCGSFELQFQQGRMRAGSGVINRLIITSSRSDNANRHDWVFREVTASTVADGDALTAVSLGMVSLTKAVGSTVAVRNTMCP